MAPDGPDNSSLGVPALPWLQNKSSVQDPLLDLTNIRAIVDDLDAVRVRKANFAPDQVILRESDFCADARRGTRTTVF